jgi:hypothetical protein
MSALGQKRTSQGISLMSALPPKADIAETDWHVRFVPKADMSDLSHSNQAPPLASRGDLHAKGNNCKHRLCVVIDPPSIREQYRYHGIL